MPRTPIDYRYDPLGRLISVAGSQRFYNKARLATEIQGAVQHSVFQQGDQLLAERRLEAATGHSTLLATDLQRSVLQRVSTTGQQSLAYNVYGHRPSESGLSSLLGFNGERADSMTGHYLLGNGYRAFNPVLMRFNSPDSWSPFGRGGINSYGYAGGDSVNRVDPSGHFWRAFGRAFKSWIFKNGQKSSLSHAAYKRGSMSADYENLKELRLLSEDAYTALQQDTEGKFTTLVVMAHGALTKSDGGHKMALLKSGNGFMTAHEVARSLTDRGYLEGVREIHLAMCYSGNFAEKSFASIVAKETNLMTKGYLGEVYGMAPEKILASIEKHPDYTVMGEFRTQRVVRDRAALIREGHPSYLFNPVRFSP
ncbi:hypothetical protein AQS70_16210 [Pseudomonas endophytica]|uniref:RHS repeat-associated core domain-containing protein n=1 Tax=Pseudomonas endophytica TaxID=1563157 RepID=A0A0Q0SKK0_9PSED|nr:RHS repeat-associated core domain-containing protein [Pseudomonas endophytica]KQB51959.1 hypothetical protein AQS70_16210 [Pseudomonas endophytica]